MPDWTSNPYLPYAGIRLKDGSFHSLSDVPLKVLTAARDAMARAADDRDVDRALADSIADMVVMALHKRGFICWENDRVTAADDEVYVVMRRDDIRWALETALTQVGTSGLTRIADMARRAGLSGFEYGTPMINALERAEELQRINVSPYDQDGTVPK